MAEKIVLTVCSANYLAQAKALGDSLIKHNLSYKLVIGLVDKLNGRVNADYYYPHEIIEVDELSLPEFADMRNRYTDLELVCSLKSFFTDYLFTKYQPSHIIFLDCDILIFDSLGYIENALNDSSILLTPHITRPFPLDNRKPEEKTILKTGMFNAGFYALRNDDIAKAFLNWWKERMIDQGYERPKEGLNADQKWLNFLPLYFNNVRILTHAGCNVAYWNLHERNIEKRGDKFFVNNEPLFFFHYSGYSVQQPDKISRHQDRFSFEVRPELKELFDLYHATLINNNHEKMLSLKCYYQKDAGSIFKKLGLKK
jgi:hypothetical protein